MGSVILKEQEITGYIGLSPDEQGDVRHTSRLQQMLIDWIASRSSLQSYWQRFKGMHGSRQVSYHAWARHGACLEMNARHRRD